MKTLNKILHSIGPGFITGASDDDPSGIGTYAQTGAMFGYTQLWTALFSFPFMSVVQEMCGRVGLVSGLGLGGVLKKYYPKPILYGTVTLLLIANTLNVGADLGAMAASLQLVVPIPYPALLVIVTTLTLGLQILIPYRIYAKYLKYLTFSLFAYFFVALIVKQDWGAILYSTFVPQISFSREYLFNIVAILGTTISPYLFFWQPSEELEEQVVSGRILQMGDKVRKLERKELFLMRVDTVFGMFFSNIVMFFIIVTAASTLGVAGITHIDTAAQAAQALRPLAGNFAFILFTGGIIGTGLLALPVLAGSSAYAVSEGLGWKRGLYNTFTEARGFYGIITVSTLIGLLVNFLPISPFVLLYYTAVVNGLIAPVLLVMILLITNNKKIMKKFTNSVFSNIFGVIITVLMSLCALALIASWVL